MLTFLPRGVLDEILNLIELVSEDFSSYSSQKSGNMSSVKTLEELGVSIATDNLSADQLLRVRQVLWNWSHTFSTGPTDLGKSEIVKHEIKLKDNTPFKDPYRRIQPAMFEEVRQHLREMLEADAIKPSQYLFLPA